MYQVHSTRRCILSNSTRENRPILRVSLYFNLHYTRRSPRSRERYLSSVSFPVALPSECRGGSSRWNARSRRHRRRRFGKSRRRAAGIERLIDGHVTRGKVRGLAAVDVLLHADASNARHLFRAFEYLAQRYVTTAIMSLHDKYNVNCITNV